MVADVVGYSTLMEQDESGTLASVSRIVTELIEPLISEHRGRIVKLMGDGVLAEFSSVVDAVECAIAWQRQVADDPRGFEFRIGVNLGDIMVQDGDIFGNDVNVAARLESMADAGGICVSGTVHAEVKNKLELAFEDLGFPAIKNIAEPVQVFRIASESAASTDELARRSHAHEKPSIAVLAFTNMSGDPDQDYFSDGVSEDIITGLARFRTLVVIARNSSFSFRGQNRSSTEIGDELGVQYVAVLPGRVQHDVADRAARKPTSNMKAYELLLQGKALRDGLNAQDTAKARLLYEKALELDQSYARVCMYLADTYVVDSWLGLADADAPRNALEIARKGAALDNRDVFIQDQLRYAYLCSGLWEDMQYDSTHAPSGARLDLGAGPLLRGTV
jgi:adenylate cyclase